MGALAPSHWILLLLVIVLLFGTGRLSSVMADFAKGIKAFKKNMADDHDVSMEASEPRAGTIPPPGTPAPPAAHAEPSGIHRG
jgi:sec-independent protein translocase protein TatA